MSAGMEFQTTIRKMHEVVHMDFSNWTGAQVGRHLYRAGEARMKGEHYMFPGYIKFPIRKYDNKNPAHLPFELDMTAWPKLIVMENGAAEWNAMRNHWKAFVPTLLQAGRSQLRRTGIIPSRQGNNGQQPGPQRPSATSPNVSAPGNRTVNGQISASSQPGGDGSVQARQSSNVDDPRPGTSTQQEPNVNQIQPLLDDDAMPHINILESIRDVETQSNVDVTTAQPSNASAPGVPLPNASQHGSHFSRGVQPVLDNVSASTAIEPNDAAVHLPPDVVPDVADEVVDLPRANDIIDDGGFGPENLSALNRAAIADFGYRPVTDREPRQDQINGLGDEDHSLEQSFVISRPILQARRRTNVRTIDPNIRTEELPAEELRQLIEEATQALVMPVVPKQPIATSTPDRGQGTAINVTDPNADAIAPGQLSVILEDMVVPPPDYADTSNVPGINVISPDDGNNASSVLAPPAQTLPGQASTLRGAVENTSFQLIQPTDHENQNQPTEQDSLDEHGLPRRRDPGSASRAIKKAVSKLGRNRQNNPRPPQIQIQRVPEHEVTLHPRLGNRPDLSAFYDRIYEMIFNENVVEIESYLEHYANVPERMHALAALADVASEGQISIERDGANGPILRFRREM